MTTEEKYNKALELARTYYNGGNEFLDTIFPELKESEDERIRRDIIHYILYKADGVSEEQEHSWIAYLEKQKEPLTPEEKMNHPLYLEGFDVGREVGAVVAKPAEWSDSFEENIRNLLHDKLTWHSDDGSISTTVFIDDKTIKDIVMGIWFYVGKEAMKNPNMELPKAEWSDEYREEDLRTRFAFYTYKDEDSVLYLSNVFVEETSRNKGFGTKILAAAEKVAETLGAIQIRLKVKQDSPANAWYRKHGYGYMAFEDGYDWLEKNLEYMKPIKPAERSEKEIVNWAYDNFRVSSFDMTKIVTNFSSMDELERSLREKLKSLRSQPHWKPSDEQMRYLLAVINDPNNIGAESCYMTIKSLYNDLNKL